MFLLLLFWFVLSCVCVFVCLFVFYFFNVKINSFVTMTEPVSTSSGAAGLLENLQQAFSRVMRLKPEEKEEVPKVLDEVSFEAVARYIQSGKCKNIITMVGAGISTCESFFFSFSSSSAVELGLLLAS
jgi:hypothetical protein